MNGTAMKDGVFKIIILAVLIFSILIQIVVSGWIYEKIKTLENRLSLYPVNKPVEVDLRVTIPELVEIDGKIDKLTERLGMVLTSHQSHTVQQERTKAARSTNPDKKKARTGGSTRVDVVEKIKN